MALSDEMSSPFEKVWTELNAIYADPLPQRPWFNSNITNSDIVRWSGYMELSRAELYDLIALRVARGYNSKELDFTMCDAIVNEIHGVITMEDESRPEMFWRIFLAFDEGEYYHDNRRDVDPEELYTRPMITTIVEEFRDR